MDYDPKKVKFENGRLEFIGSKDGGVFFSQPFKVSVEIGDKIEFVTSGWGEDPCGQFYVCQGIITKIEVGNLPKITVNHDEIESWITPTEIQQKLDKSANLTPRRLTAYY